MAAPVLRTFVKIASPSNPSHTRSIFTTNTLYKIVSGRYKTTRNRSRPLTYEQSILPEAIAHKKSWNSWNTTTLEGGHMRGEILVDDIVIRKFIVGTFHGMTASEIIIKRQHNLIRIAFICIPKINKEQMIFLVGYAQEMLGHMFQCPVKLEIHLQEEWTSVIHKYI